MKTIDQKEIREFIITHCPHPTSRDGCRYAGCDYYHTPEGCLHPDYPKFVEIDIAMPQYKITTHTKGQKPKVKEYLFLEIAIDQYQKMVQDEKPNTNYRLSSADGKSILAVYRW